MGNNPFITHHAIAIFPMKPTPSAVLRETIRQYTRGWIERLRKIATARSVGLLTATTEVRPDVTGTMHHKLLNCSMQLRLQYRVRKLSRHYAIYPG